MNIRTLNPAVDKRILIILAGTMWCGVGLMLMSYAFLWLSAFNIRAQLFFSFAGFLTAMPIHHFGFLRNADKNLSRLLLITEKKCLFSFMKWKSYLIVPVMVSMGIFLRHSILPKEYLTIIYIGIGLGLFLSGLRYFRFFIKLLFAKSSN